MPIAQGQPLREESEAIVSYPVVAGSARPGAVELDGISKHFGDRTVLDGVSLSVGKGEVVAIIGPSGAGKSTLLRCINLLEKPTAGRILVDETEVWADGGTRLSARELASFRSRVGMVFQSFNLFPHMTVLRNVSVAQVRALGRSKDEADERSIELLERVGLRHKADSHPTRCSGGEQQRVAIARALALDPSVMLFDEPTSAIDPELGVEVLTVMRDLAAGGMTMIVVTHELQFAEDVSDRIVMVADGGVIETGVPRSLLHEPQHPRTKAFLRAVLERRLSIGS